MRTTWERMERGIAVGSGIRGATATRFFTLGAGSVYQAGEKILESLKSRFLAVAFRCMKKTGERSQLSIPRIVAAVFALRVCWLIASLYGFHRVEQFLIRDPRFALNGEFAGPTLEIAGAAHASRHHIEAVFADDSGRSVYLMPLNDRRASFAQVDWVKDAAVARLWPNRVIVNVARAQAGGVS